VIKTCVIFDGLSHNLAYHTWDEIAVLRERMVKRLIEVNQSAISNDFDSTHRAEIGSLLNGLIVIDLYRQYLDDPTIIKK
jgi:hypothetical protein